MILPDLASLPTLLAQRSLPESASMARKVLSQPPTKKRWPSVAVLDWYMFSPLTFHFSAPVAASRP